MYVLAPNGVVSTYPYSAELLKLNNPNTSFPERVTENFLASWNVFPVTIELAPSYDLITEDLTQLEPELRDGVWTVSWEVTPASAEEIISRRRNHAKYPAFWDALIISTIYAAIREQSFVSLPMNTLATEFIALIGDAKAGRANEAAIQQSMNAILETGSFTEAHLNELSEALVAGNLSKIYSLPTL